MKFGAFVPQGWRHDLAGIPVDQHWQTMLDIARDIESSGFESLWVYDHFHTVPEPTQEVTYEAWALMAAFAAATDTVRLGQMCTCNTYRPPSYLAKVAASIDVISGGRLEMGIGAGWYEDEHHGYGYPFLPPPGRLGMLREGVEIMKAMWTEDVVGYHGEHYQLDGAICQPKPLQNPHIPLWIAGGGEQVTLKIAARHAQYSNFGGDDIAVFERKSDILEGHCEEVGRDFESIVRSANFNILCAETDEAVEAKKKWLRDHMGTYVSEKAMERWTRMYEAASGTPEQIVARLKGFEEAGLGYAIVNFADVAYDRSGFELFAREVIPHFS
jgi:F420-dependent oxidoreductase-like protein